MILNNPTKEDVKVILDGIPYKVEGEASVEVPDEVGARWMKIHEFLFVGKAEEVSEEKEEKKVTKKVEKKEEA